MNKSGLKNLLRKVKNGFDKATQLLGKPLKPVKRFMKYIGYKFSQMPYEKQKRIWGTIFVTPWVIGFIIFLAYPLFLTIWYSLNEVTPKTGGLNMKFIGFSNYVNSFADVIVHQKTFYRVLIESTWDLLLNLPVIMIFSLFIAVMLNTQFKGRTFVRAMFFIPVIFNSTAIDIALSGQFNSYMAVNGTGDGQTFFQSLQFQQFLLDMGIGRNPINFLISAVNRIFRIVNVSGVQILIFLAAIQSIPGHLYEAAQIEGATKYEIFWKITFPMVTPLFLTATVYTVVDSFVSSPVIDFIDTTRDNLQYGLSSAVAIVYFMINIVILLIVYSIIRLGVFYYDEK